MRDSDQKSTGSISTLFSSAHYGYCVHLLTIENITKRFKISLITTFTLQLFQLPSLVSSHVNNCEYFNFFSTIINTKINVIIFYAYSSKTKFTPRLLISIQALQKHHPSDNYHLEPPDHSLQPFKHLSSFHSCIWRTFIQVFCQFSFIYLDIHYYIDCIFGIIPNKQLLKLRNLIFWNNQQAVTIRNQIMQGTFLQFLHRFVPQNINNQSAQLLYSKIAK